MKREIGNHGFPEYGSWCHMKERCSNPKCLDYPAYGGAGISVCDRWRSSFRAFLGDMGSRPSDKHSLDRYPNRNGNYEPGNVRWATPKEQSRNRTWGRHIDFDGRTYRLSELAEAFGLRSGTLLGRLDSGWDIRTALTMTSSEARRLAAKKRRADQIASSTPSERSRIALLGVANRKLRIS